MALAGDQMRTSAWTFLADFPARVRSTWERMKAPLCFQTDPPTAIHSFAHVQSLIQKHVYWVSSTRLVSGEGAVLHFLPVQVVRTFL